MKRIILTFLSSFFVFIIYAQHIQQGTSPYTGDIYHLDGNVGIGTNSIVDKLTIGYLGGENIGIRDRRTRTSGYYSTGINFYDFNGLSASILHEHNGYFGNVGRSLKFLVNGTEKLRIKYNGNIGIGANQPSEKLTVRGDLSRFLIEDANANKSVYLGDNNAGFLNLYDASANLQIRFIADGGNNYINSGNFGIGTNDPSSPLTVQANSSGLAVRIIGRSSDNSGFLQFFANGSSSLTGAIYGSTGRLTLRGPDNSNDLNIISEGKVGIGTTSPSEKLEVNGNIKANSLIATNLNITGITATDITASSITANTYSDIYMVYNKIKFKSNPGGSGTNSIFSKNVNVNNVGEWYFDSHYDDIIINAGLSDGRRIVFQTGNEQRMFIERNGNVGIGTSTIPTGYLLAVKGKIACTEVKVTTDIWSDYVFADDYDLPTLNEVEHYIEENNHLPDVPSESEVIENGIELGDMNRILLQKIEELTLYAIEQNKMIEELLQQNNNLEQRVQQLENE